MKCDAIDCVSQTKQILEKDIEVDSKLPNILGHKSSQNKAATAEKRITRTNLKIVWFIFREGIAQFLPNRLEHCGAKTDNNFEFNLSHSRRAQSTHTLTHTLFLSLSPALQCSKAKETKWRQLLAARARVWSAKMYITYTPCEMRNSIFDLSTHYAAYYAYATCTHTHTHTWIK